MEENNLLDGKKILVVDDEPNNLTVLRRMLSEEGYRVRPTLSAEQALEAITIDAAWSLGLEDEIELVLFHECPMGDRHVAAQPPVLGRAIERRCHRGHAIGIRAGGQLL